MKFVVYNYKMTTILCGELGGCHRSHLVLRHTTRFPKSQPRQKPVSLVNSKDQKIRTSPSGRFGTMPFLQLFFSQQWQSYPIFVDLGVFHQKHDILLVLTLAYLSSRGDCFVKLDCNVGAATFCTNLSNIRCITRKAWCHGLFMI